MCIYIYIYIHTYIYIYIYTHISVYIIIIIIIDSIMTIRLYALKLEDAAGDAPNAAATARDRRP